MTAGVSAEQALQHADRWLRYAVDLFLRDERRYHPAATSHAIAAGAQLRAAVKMATPENDQRVWSE